MRNALLASVLCVAACARGEYASYVSPLSSEQAPQIAADMAGFVNARIRPGDGSVQIEQADGDQAVGPNLVADLKGEGFTVVSSGGKHRIRFAAGPLGDEIMARISVDRADGARLYGHMPNIGLSPRGPFSVTETER
jgi:hypothetical protein